MNDYMMGKSTSFSKTEELVLKIMTEAIKRSSLPSYAMIDLNRKLNPTKLIVDYAKCSNKFKITIHTTCDNARYAHMEIIDILTDGSAVDKAICAEVASMMLVNAVEKHLTKAKNEPVFLHEPYVYVICDNLESNNKKKGIGSLSAEYISSGELSKRQTVFKINEEYHLFSHTYTFNFLINFLDPGNLPAKETDTLLNLYKGIEHEKEEKREN